MNINPNDFVRIKLTEEGKRLIVKHIDETNHWLQQRGPQCTFRAKVPEWDADGWLKGQFHDLMGMFDGCWRIGHDLPFSELKEFK